MTLDERIRQVIADAGAMLDAYKDTDCAMEMEEAIYEAAQPIVGGLLTEGEIADARQRFPDFTMEYSIDDGAGSDIETWASIDKVEQADEREAMIEWYVHALVVEIIDDFYQLQSA